MPNEKRAAGDDLPSEDRLRRLERALQDVTAERTELWAELHRRKALEHEVEHYKNMIHSFEQSRSWRLTAPLRTVKSKVDRLRALARLGRRRLRGL